MLRGLSYDVPRWLVEALGQTWVDGLLPNFFDIPGFDHVRTYKGRVVISQIYETSEQFGPVLVRLAQRGIRARLWGTSPYFPGHTFSVVIWRTEDESCAQEIMEKMHKSFAWDKCEAASHEEWS